MSQLYLDLDGVLADFDKAAEAQLGTNNIYKYEFIHGPKVFWEKLHSDANFFRNLPKMDGADFLWASVSKLHPKILTALPKTGAERVDVQKRAWVKKNFPYANDVITCRTEEKPNYCKPGDILIDDRAVNRASWKEKGGLYILHTSAANTVVTLKSLGIID